MGPTDSNVQHFKGKAVELQRSLDEGPEQWFWSPTEQAQAKVEEVEVAFRRKADACRRSGCQGHELNWLVIVDESPFYLLTVGELLAALPKISDPELQENPR
jgi:hypothetical protein